MGKKFQKMFFAASLLLAGDALAAGYEPLVRIPGMQESGVIDISVYLVSIYNFLLSIVGIVAVIMLIIGGMKYITAAGNSGAVTNAKDTIWSALLGLGLAILSWVIVSTINPDVLYLRQPGASFNAALDETANLGFCYSSFNSRTNECICKDENNTSLGMLYANAQACSDACLAQNLCGNRDLSSEYTCIAPGSPYDENDLGYTEADGCTCADGNSMQLPEGSDCNTACKDARRCGNKFLIIKMHLIHADRPNSGDNYYHLSATEGDELWDFFLTNDGGYGPFNVTAEFRQDNPEFNCAILVTNEIPLLPDQNFIYWVRNGTRIIRGGGSMYEQIANNTSSCCGEDQNDCRMDWLLWGGTCVNNNGAQSVLLAKFSEDIANKCQNCGFAEWAGDKPIYRPSHDIKCVNGYWQ